MRSVAVVTVLMGAALLGTAPASSDVATLAPSVGEIAALAVELSEAKAVRVTGPFGTQVLRDVRLDSSGVASARWGPGGAPRPALITTADAMPPATPSPRSWSDISRIETGKTNTARYGIIGLALGGLVGAVVLKTIPLGEDGGEGSPAMVVGVPAAAGLALGAFLGSQQYRWNTVYPGR